MPGLLNLAFLKKLPENLLSKGDQNKIMTKRLGLSTTIGKMYHKTAGIEIFGYITDWTEDVQINMLGDSRKLFASSILNSKEEIKEE